MRAVQIKEFGGVNELYIGDVADPIAQEHQVLIKVHAAALNRADLLQRQGKYPPPAGESDILGLEVAGEVVEPDSTGKWSKGDRVMALLAGGGQAELVAIDKDLVMAIPPNLTYEQAAAIPEVFLAAYQAMFYEGKLKHGGSILIHAGASGVGTAAIQLAKMRGANVVITASAKKHKSCIDLGADLAIDYQQEDFKERVVEFTAGRGIDMVLDFIGGPNFMKNIEALAIGGTLIQIAMMGGAKTDNVNLYPLLRKHITIIGTTLRSRSIAYKTDLIQQFAKDFLELLATGKITPVIDSVYNLSEIQDAHRRMEDNLNVGKMVLKV